MSNIIYCLNFKYIKWVYNMVISDNCYLINNYAHSLFLIYLQNFLKLLKI